MSAHDKAAVVAVTFLAALSLTIYIVPPAFAWLAVVLVTFAVMILLKLWFTVDDRAAIFNKRTALLTALSVLTAEVGFVLPYPLDWWCTGNPPTRFGLSLFTLFLAAPFTVAAMISYWLNSVALVVTLALGLVALSTQMWIAIAVSTSSTAVLGLLVLPIYQIGFVTTATVVCVLTRWLRRGLL